MFCVGLILKTLKWLDALFSFYTWCDRLCLIAQLVFRVVKHCSFWFWFLVQFVNNHNHWIVRKRKKTNSHVLTPEKHTPQWRNWLCYWTNFFFFFVNRRNTFTFAVLWPPRPKTFSSVSQQHLLGHLSSQVFLNQHSAFFLHISTPLILY